MIHEYSLSPYPKKLWVVKDKGFNPSDVFLKRDGSVIDYNNDERDRARASVYPVMHKETGYYGFLVLIYCRLNVSDVSHEAFHVADGVFDDCGVMLTENTGNEHMAYLIGYIAGCLWDVNNNKIKDSNE